jgi:hypothetical protein
MGDGDRGVARITDKECAKFILGCADCWDELRHGWEVVFVNGGTRLHVSDQFREVVSHGLHVANCLGEDHETTLDFFRFIDLLLKRGNLAEPDDRKLRRREGSSAHSRKKSKSCIDDILVRDVDEEPERAVSPPTFPPPPRLPQRPATPAKTEPNFRPQNPQTVPKPPPGPVLVRGCDQVTLTSDHAARLKVLTTAFAHDVYERRSAPTEADMIMLFPTVDVYNEQMRRIMALPKHSELMMWHRQTLSLTRLPGYHDHFGIKNQLEMDMYRYSPNPQRPWAFSATQWTKYLRQTGCPKTIWEVCAVQCCIRADHR